MSKPNLKIKFLGGAGCVTGSKILLESNNQRILIDCGLFQGIKKLRNLNRAPLGVDPATIDAVVLTHAHLDHCGYLPLLVKNGFEGNIHCTFPTKELASIILLDSAKIQEEEAEQANRYGYSKHKPAKPLYDIEDAKRAISMFVPHQLHEWVILNNEFKFNLKNSGHILGAAMVEMKSGGQKLLFSGDIGQQKPLILATPEKVKETDILIVESTYGDRVHRNDSPLEQLESVINKTHKKGGVLIIPTFTVERAQEIIYLLNILKRENRIPRQPVYLDSPMGVDASAVFIKYDEWSKLSEKEVLEIMSNVDLIKDHRASKAVVADNAQKIVLAGSGMIEGGRVLHYLDKYLEDAKNTVLLVGYQAAGTRGRALQEGAKEIKFFGNYHQVKAELATISSLSAHADYQDILEWLSNFKKAPKMVFLNHGEPHQADALRTKIKHYFGWNVTVAVMNEVYEIEPEQTSNQAIQPVVTNANN